MRSEAKLNVLAVDASKRKLFVERQKPRLRKN
jgi:hypothetical protein